MKEALNVLGNLDRVEEWALDWYQGDGLTWGFHNTTGICQQEERDHNKVWREKHQEMLTLWFENIDKALNKNKTSFAVVPIYYLLNQDVSLSNWLAEKGHEIKAP